MGINSEDQETRPEQSPRFMRAGYSARILWKLSWVLAAIILAFLISSLFAELLAPGSIWVPALRINAASLLILLCGVRSAQHVANWRNHVISSQRTAEPEHQEPKKDPGSPILPQVDPAGAAKGNPALKWAERIARSALQSVGLPSIEVGGLALIAMFLVGSSWDLTLPAANTGPSTSVCAGLLLALAFSLLVLERQLAGSSSAEWPEAAKLAQLARLPILTISVSALCLFASQMGGVWPVWVIVLVGVFPAAIALELLLRAVLAVFGPAGPGREPTAVAESFLAELLNWPPPSLLAAFQDDLRNRTGIDLRQVWAFSFIRRAMLPVIACMILAGWLLTGVREIPLDGRGIYERFGEPQAVLGPGLHIGMPWPLGRIVPVENGIIHELAAATPKDSVTDEPPTAEGPAPASSNRLWDVYHPMEKAQLIASQEKSGQSFQIVDLDIRFVYRIGLSDEAALDATYNTTDLPALIRSTAGQVLVHEFASRTLDSVLGEGRTALAQDIGSALRAELDRLKSGVEILAVVIEAIHPPAGAADAYHSVQAAEIGVQALVTRERGNAAEQLNGAQTNATTAQDNAKAAGVESISQADQVRIRTGAERKAYEIAGTVFLQEQYFNHLKRGLWQAGMLILDHRIENASAPTIDLRDIATPVLPTVPGPAALGNPSHDTNATGGANDTGTKTDTTDNPDGPDSVDTTDNPDATDSPDANNPDAAP